MLVTEEQSDGSRSGGPHEDIAGVAKSLESLLAEAGELVRDKIEKAGSLAASLSEAARTGQALSLFPLMRILSLLNRALESAAPGDDAERAMCAAIETVRELIARRGRKFAENLSVANLDRGEILPAERLEQVKPGKILLALDPAIGERAAAMLRHFGHEVVIARGAADLLAEFGFGPAAVPLKGAAAGGPAAPAAFCRAEHGKKVAYAFGAAGAPSAPRVSAPPDVVLGDLFSAGFAGFELQEFLKARGEFIETRVIIASPLEESKCVARAIQLGADDYLGWDVEPSVLLARIESSIDRKRHRTRRRLYQAALSRARESLEDELRRGAEYVRCLLPGKISGAALSTDWLFIPSASLGGDLFGYHKLPDGRMVFFMIDVSGHGVQSALYSVTIFDALRSGGLKNVDFGDPVSVMRGVNHAFRMEERNNMLFTLWYGVWDEMTRTLSHASAGSPPAVLIVRGGGAIELKTEGMVAGADPDADYRKQDIQIPRGSRLFLFSDGIYEFFTGPSSMLGLEAFVQLLERAASGVPGNGSSISAILRALAAFSPEDPFQDDVSLLEVRFD